MSLENVLYIIGIVVGIVVSIFLVKSLLTDFLSEVRVINARLSVIENKVIENRPSNKS